MMSSAFSGRTAALLMLLTAGCGGPVISEITEFSDLHPVSGKVSFKGSPIPGASVRMFPVKAVPGAAVGDVHTAVVGEDGSFEMHTFRADGRGMGVPEGEYGICLSWTGGPDVSSDLSRDELPEKLPAKYTRPQTSGLRVTVAPGGTIVPDIEMK